LKFYFLYIYINNAPSRHITSAVTELRTKVGLRQSKINIVRKKVEGISGIPGSQTNIDMYSYTG